MGGQLSSSSPSSSASSPSPGLSSIGSNGQQSARCRSPPPTQSASQSSLALSISDGCCSSSSTSSHGGCGAGDGPIGIGRHSSSSSSAAFIRPLGTLSSNVSHHHLHLHHHPPIHSSSSPLSTSSSFHGHSRFLISPPMFRRNDHGNGKIGAGGGKQQPSLSRWGSFTKALPTLIRGSSTTTNGVGHGKHHQQNGKEQQLKRHNNQMAPIGRKYTNSTAAGVDPNNNNHGYFPAVGHPHFVPSFAQNRPKSPWSDEERMDEDDEEANEEEEETDGRHEFSLKASLKKSGSRLFNGILKGGYLKALLGDDDDDEREEGDNEEEEDEMDGKGDENERRRWSGRRTGEEEEKAIEVMEDEHRKNHLVEWRRKSHEEEEEKQQQQQDELNNNNAAEKDEINGKIEWMPPHLNNGIGSTFGARKGPIIPGYGQWPRQQQQGAQKSHVRQTNSSLLFHNHSQSTAASIKSISTSALRSSLRQAKKTLMHPHHHNHPNHQFNSSSSNGNCLTTSMNRNSTGNGTFVSSMLLAMAAGGRRPAFNAAAGGVPSSSPSIARRPFSCPSNQIVDWNGNNNNTNILASHTAEMLPGQRKKIIQASSSELIRALGQFIYENCHPGLLGRQFEPAQLSTWLRGVDRALILQGWQDVAFINPANLVFLFMLIRDAFAEGECQRLNSLRELHTFVLLCLYVSYSYMGNEISYPLKPFITENTNRTLFWSKCVRLIKRHSRQMLRLNSSSTFFLEVFTELKGYCPPSTATADYLPPPQSLNQPNINNNNNANVAY